jgi:fatty-acyl-CoA synthase
MHVPLTVGDFLERAAWVHGDRVAVVDEPGVPGALGPMTYAEMHARARGMALALDALGTGHGDRVAVVTPNSARMLVAFFGVSGFGRVLVPVNFRLNAEEVGYIVEHSGATVLLVDPELEASLAGVSAKVRIVLDGKQDAQLFAPAPPGTEPAPWPGDEAATCSINYTSGTTARPKGV